MNVLCCALLFLAAGTPAWAQFRFFESEGWQFIQQPPGKGVIADITSTLKAPTPWGEFTQTENGKYWRSRKGKVRQDDSYGLSTVIDLSSSQRSRAHIDYELRRIWIATAQIRGAPPKDITGSDFHLLSGSEKLKKSGQDVVEGFKVTIRTGELLHFPPTTNGQVIDLRNDQHMKEPKGEPAGMVYEIWTSDELKMILLFKLKSGTTEFVQRYHNIHIEEPDPSIFQLPAGFNTVTISPASAVGCLRQEAGINTESRTTEVTRPCIR